ncbi:MAG: hypothetical protein JG782_40 [Anaerophaga sp.]|nr:hypothetical protein [Anaerophaga sp.]MDI3520118.1 hypothetical protein [Anaerophaga sp.]
MTCYAQISSIFKHVYLNTHKYNASNQRYAQLLANFVHNIKDMHNQCARLLIIAQ